MKMEMMTTAQFWIIKACLAKTKEEQQEAVQNWEAQVCMDELDFSSMRLIPYFFHRNQQAGITTKHDKRIKVIYKHWWLRSQHISHELKAVQQALSEAGIKVIVIKGAAIKMHYEKEELRPMADFDLLIARDDLESALQITKELNFLPGITQQIYLQKVQSFFLDFHHAITLTNTQNDTQLDLHWRIGFGCSNQFLSDLWQHLEDYDINSTAKKPQLAYEVFMIIVHAVDTESQDNLNWIIDIAVINSKHDQSFWQEARQIAIKEKKQDLFDYGCSILLKLGVYAPNPGDVKKPKTLASFDYETRHQLSRLQRQKVRFQYSLIQVNRLFPHANWFLKSYQIVRKMRFSLLMRKFEKIED